jgi:hypothetical protein
MWKLVTICAATTLLCILACCASTPPPVPGDEESGEVPISADILAEIGRRASKDHTETRLIEIRYIIEAAERIYLEGNYIVAVELLTEAEELLRNIP